MLLRTVGANAAITHVDVYAPPFFFEPIVIDQ
jgi:hypothetical protein